MLVTKPSPPRGGGSENSNQLTLFSEPISNGGQDLKARGVKSHLHLAGVNMHHGRFGGKTPVGA